MTYKSFDLIIAGVKNSGNSDELPLKYYDKYIEKRPWKLTGAFYFAYRGFYAVILPDFGPVSQFRSSSASHVSPLIQVQSSLDLSLYLAQQALVVLDVRGLQAL